MRQWPGYCRRTKALLKFLNNHLPFPRLCRCRAAPRQKFRYSRCTPAHGRRCCHCHRFHLRQWPGYCRRTKTLLKILIYHLLLPRRYRCRVAPRQRYRYSSYTPAHGRRCCHCHRFDLHQWPGYCRRTKSLLTSLSDHLPLLRLCRCRVAPRQRYRYSRYTPAHGRHCCHWHR